MSSRAFEVRRNAGACPLCSQKFHRGEMAVYATARAQSDGSLRPLSAPEAEELRQATRRAMNLARQNGQRGRGPIDIPWLWEQMAHVDCADGLGLVDRPGTTTARPGRRTIGWNDTTTGALVAASPTAPDDPPVTYLPPAQEPPDAPQDDTGEVDLLLGATRPRREPAPAPAPAPQKPWSLSNLLDEMLAAADTSAA